MLKHIFAIGILVVCSSAYAETPSDELILEFMRVSNVKGTLENMRTNADIALRNSFMQSLQYQKLNDRQKKIAREASDKVVEIQRESLTYDRIVNLVLPLYRRTFTKEELQAAIDFYHSPAGQSINRKMPLLAAASMRLTAELNQKVIPQYQKIVQETAERIRLAK